MREEDGVRVIDIQRPRDTRLPRPFGVLVNRWHKTVRLFAKAVWMWRLAAERPDLLQVRDQLTEAVLARFFTRSYGVRFAYQWDFPHFEARLHLRDGSWPWILRFQIAVRAWVMRGADLVLPISVGQGAVARDRHGVDPTRIVPFPVGVASDAMRRAREGSPHPKAAALRSEPALCYLGNLHAMRQPTLLFEIFSAVLEEMPEARLLLVGQITPEVGRLLEGFAGRDRIVRTGQIPHQDVPATIATARVGVFPIPVSDSYDIYRTSSPLKVVEYMACGLPVVSSSVEDAERLLGESGGGVCADNDPRVFAREVVAYLRDPERARSDGDRGQAYIERYRSFEVLARDLEAAYQRLLSTGSPAPAESPLVAPISHATGVDALPARRRV